MLRAVAAHLEPGGRAAFALLADLDASDHSASSPLPDVVELDGWVYSSQPVEVAAVPGGYEVRRLRQAVSPGGELDSELDAVLLYELRAETFAAEAQQEGLAEVDRLDVLPTPEHVGSVVCVLEKSR